MKTPWTSPNHRHRWLLLALATQFSLLLWIMTPSCGTSTPRRAPARTVVAKTCADCHQDFIDQISGTPHLENLEGSCEECHGPHGIVGVLKLTVEEPQLCLKCHEDAQAYLDASHPHSALLEGNCSACHDPHASNNATLLKDVGPKLCFTCHAAEDYLSGAVHEPVAEDCLTCHNPHGGDVADGMKKTVPALCLDCHESTESEFIGAHKDYDVSRSDCGVCHTPHASRNPGMMRAAVHGPVGSGECEICHVAPSEVGANDDFPGLLLPPTQLCVDCHQDEVAEFKSRETLHEPMVTGDCMKCHAAHASENPMMVIAPHDTRLCGQCHEETTEQIGQFSVFRGSMHEPVAEGKCMDCHDPHGGAKGLLTLPEQELCVTCHDPVAQDLKKAVPHEAMETCSSCHSAHGSTIKPILRANPVDLCIECHDEYETRMNNEQLHEPVALGQCVTCHDPHGSDHPNILQVEQGSLCQRCHTNITAQVVGGSSHEPVTKGECFECHDPHSSIDPDLLVAKGSELCSRCHEETTAAIEDLEFRHAPAEAGACLACHGPHTAPREHLLSLPTEDLCRTCHSVVLEEMTWPGYQSHEPAAEGKCLDCHMSHSSANPGLAIMPSPALCWSCHEADTPEMQAAHLGQVREDLDCLACHAPHSAEGAGLFWPNRHPPFAEKTCEECHLEKNE